MAPSLQQARFQGGMRGCGGNNAIRDSLTAVYCVRVLRRSRACAGSQKPLELGNADTVVVRISVTGDTEVPCAVQLLCQVRSPSFAFMQDHRAMWI